MAWKNGPSPLPVDVAPVVGRVAFGPSQGGLRPPVRRSVRVNPRDALRCVKVFLRAAGTVSTGWFHQWSGPAEALVELPDGSLHRVEASQVQFQPWTAGCADE